MEKLEVKAAEGVSELVVRQGDALPVNLPVKIIIDGTLKAPAEYLDRKQPNYNSLNAHVLVRKTSGKITLVLNDKDATGDVVTGAIKLNPIIGEFGVNTEKKWTINELRQFIQRMSFFFDTRDEYTKMLEALQKFKSSVIKLYQNENSNDGNSKLMLESKIEDANMVKSFKLNLPVYLGYEKQSFNVEIGLDVTSSDTRIFLYSEELFHLQEDLKEQYINAEIKKLEGMALFGVCSMVTID